MASDDTPPLGPKAIDRLVVAHLQSQAETVELGRQIAKSATPTVVAFVDLAESTHMKLDRRPEDWVGHVYRFLQRVAQLADQCGGVTIKRIGDEAMLSFSSVEVSERFIDSLIPDPVLSTYHYKVAIDWGLAYHFKFPDRLGQVVADTRAGSTRPDDPYGLMVDRCARISKYAVAGTALTTADYVNQLHGTGKYVSMGRHSLIKFPGEPQELLLRSLTSIDAADYLAPFIGSINRSRSYLDGYQAIGRRLTTQFIRDFDDSDVRPFLARELLNVPPLPYSPRELWKVIEDSGRLVEKGLEFLGYFVEWEGIYEKFERDRREYLVLELSLGDSDSSTLKLMLSLNYLEMAKLWFS